MAGQVKGEERGRNLHAWEGEVLFLQGVLHQKNGVNVDVEGRREEGGEEEGGQEGRRAGGREEGGREREEDMPGMTSVLPLSDSETEKPMAEIQPLHDSSWEYGLMSNICLAQGADEEEEED